MKILIFPLTILIFFYLFGCSKNENKYVEKSITDSVKIQQSNKNEIKKDESEIVKSGNQTKTFTEPCDEEASRFVINNMSELTSKIDKTNRTYFISHSLWISMSDYDKKRLITAVADAHACLEKKAYKIKFIDDLTNELIAQAHPELGIKVID
jgi:hypothetical protein